MTMFQKAFGCKIGAKIWENSKKCYFALKLLVLNNKYHSNQIVFIFKNLKTDNENVGLILSTVNKTKINTNL